LCSAGCRGFTSAERLRPTRRGGGPGLAPGGRPCDWMARAPPDARAPPPPPAADGAVGLVSLAGRDVSAGRRVAPAADMARAGAAAAAAADAEDDDDDEDEDGDDVAAGRLADGADGRGGVAAATAATDAGFLGRRPRGTAAGVALADRRPRTGTILALAALAVPAALPRATGVALATAAALAGAPRLRAGLGSSSKSESSESSVAQTELSPLTAWGEAPPTRRKTKIATNDKRERWGAKHKIQDP